MSAPPCRVPGLEDRQGVIIKQPGSGRADHDHLININNNNNRRLVTLAEHTSDHGRQTNSSTMINIEPRLCGSYGGNTKKIKINGHTLLGTQ